MGLIVISVLLSYSSASFDTIDLDKLLEMLYIEIGIDGTAL